MNPLARTLSLCISLILGHAAAADTELVYIGTRGAATSEQPQTNASHGIYALSLDTATGVLALLGLQAERERVMWLAAHPSLPVLYAATASATNVGAESNVQSFAIDRNSGKLTQLDSEPSGGIGATHLAIDKTSATLFVAHFGSGNVTALPMLYDGRLQAAASSRKQYGTGPHRRQNAPHAHGIAVAPAGDTIVATDFGADRIFFYDFDSETRGLTPKEPAFQPTPPGSGPRHLLFDPKGKFLYLNTELSAELRQYRWNSRRKQPQLIGSQSLYPESHPGEKSSAGMVMSADGRFLYISLRGDQNSVVAYAVAKRSGALKEIHRLEVNGKAPWSIGIDPSGRWMLVTNEASNTVIVLGVDRRTGRLSATEESVSIPKPVSLTFDQSQQ
jgi:6-phosphogluconolactonase